MDARTAKLLGGNNLKAMRPDSQQTGALAALGSSFHSRKTGEVSWWMMGWEEGRRREADPTGQVYATCRWRSLP
ncbi:Uncharacterized protein HZ326_13409 [Fusarium oxysporum f. sp. albedinis]|nr:Uncharacterized protein HZ326_13409 [Fusarium oxysporum f. sp. albedinis]